MKVIQSWSRPGDGFGTTLAVSTTAMKMRWILLLVALLVASPAWAANFFVNQSGGSDANSCALANNILTPKATITGGVNCALQPGDTVLVVGNAVQYNEAPTAGAGQFSGLFLQHSGSAALNITISGNQNADGSFDRPIWCVAGRNVPSDTVGGSNGVVHTNSQSFIHIAHFEVCEHMDLGVISGGQLGAGNVLIEDIVTNGRPDCCTQGNSPNPVSFALVDGNTTNAVHDITFINNWSKGSVTSNGPCPGPVAGSSCNELNYNHIFLDHFNGVVIQNNQFDGAPTPFGGGIILKHFGQNLTITKNFFNDMDSHCFEITQFADSNPAIPSTVSGITFSQNVCQGRLNSGGISTASSARGVTSLPFSNFEWSNNTFYSDAVGAKASSFQGVGAPTGTWKWFNNLVRYTTNTSQRYLVYGVSPVATLNDYNSYSRTVASDGNFWFREGTGSTCSNSFGGCFISGWRTMTGFMAGQPDAHSLVGTDPHLANAGGATVTDYRSTDSAGTGVYSAGSSDGTTGGTPTGVGAWLTPTDTIGLLTGLQVMPPVRLDFGSVFLGSAPVDQSFTIQNLSDNLVSVTVTIGGAAGPFSLVGPTTVSVPAGGAGTVTVRFDLTSFGAGTYTRPVTFASSLETTTRSVTGVATTPRTVLFSAPTFSVIQGNTATVTVNRTGDPTGTSTVHFGTADGSAVQPGDYTAANGTLTFSSGQTSRTFSVATRGGSPIATSKNVNLTLSSPGGGVTLGTQPNAQLDLTGGPDLVMTQVIAPATGAAGQTIMVPNTVANHGGAGSIAPSFKISFFISPSSNAPGAGVLIGNRSMVSLAGNVNSAATTALTIPANTAAGSYFLSAVADPDNVVGEWDETNNGLTAPTQINISQPDLQMTAVTPPGFGSPSSTISVANTVRNAGSVAGGFTIGFFIHPTDNTPGAGVQIGSRTVTGLAGGATSAATSTLTIPGNTSVGAYFFSAVADIGNTVIESTETNNGLTSPTQINIGSDLLMSALTAPAQVAPGATISVANTVQNTGAAALAFNVGFFIHQTDNTPGAGVRIGTRNLTGLAGGTTNAATTILTVPGNTSVGTYFLSAVADVDNTAPELNETNNGRTAATKMIVGPDLQVSALTAPAIGAVGGTISVANTVLNPGSLASAFNVAFFISSTDNTPGAGTQIGSRSLTGLAAGTSSVATTTLTIPAGTPVGTYFLSAVADCPSAPCTAPGAVSEADEANNGRTAPTQMIVGADLRMMALTAPAQVAPGGTISVANTVQNTGAAALAFNVGFFISSSDNTPGAGTQIGARSLTTGLAAASTSAATTTLTVPAGTPIGRYFLSAVADVGSAVTELNEANNGLTAPTQILVGPDLQVSALSAPSSAALGGTIAVANTVVNPGSAAGAFRVAFFLKGISDTTPGNGTQIGFRDLTGLAAAGSSVATTTLTIPGNTAIGSYYLSAVADCPSAPCTAPGAVTETDETNNSLTATPAIVIGADLQTTALTVPASVAPGGTISVANTVRNAASAAGAFNVGFFISTTSNTPGDGVQIGTRSLTGLAGGASMPATTVLTVPANTSLGTYFVSAVADPAGAIADLDSTNNGLTAPTRLVVGPDLQVTALTASGPAAAGGSLTLNSTVANTGSATSATFQVSYFLSATNLPGSGVLLGNRSISMLAAGGTSAAASTFTVPANTALGSYFVSAVADSTNVVPEANETNNTRVTTTQIVVGPDLQLSVLTAPAFAAPSSAITVPNTVVNAGSATTSTIRVQFFVNQSGTAGTGTAIGTRDLTTGLAAGASSAATTSLTLPALAAGRYFLTASVDSLSVVSEANESNNTIVAPTQIVVGPDLQMSALTAPANAAPNAPIAVANTVRNAGSATPGGFTISFFLSSSSNAPGAGTQFAQTRAVTTSMAGGTTSAATTTLTIPAATPFGLYFLSAVADCVTAVCGTGTVAEADETNNGLTAPTQIVIGPDLQMSALTAPAFGAPGSTISVANTVRNSGSAESASFTVGFFISSSSSTPGAGTQIGSRTATALAGGASSVAATTLTVPANTPLGTYFLSAVADTGSAVTEENETDNGLTAPTRIVIGPDLQMSALTAPATGTPGTTISVANTVKNAGSATPGGFTIRFFLSPADNTPGAGTPFATTRAVTASMAGGTTAAATTTLTIPAGTALGRYFLSAVADCPAAPCASPGAVAEADETNNGLTAPTQIMIGTDLRMTALTAPAFAAPGAAISVPNTVANNGVAATASIQVAFFINTDGSAGTGTPIGTRTLATGLGTAATSAATTTLTIPAGTTPGRYFLTAKVDALSAVTEADETNNALVAPTQIVIGPDLQMSALVAPPSGVPGGTITVPNTVRNTGSTTPGGFVVTFFLSSTNVPGSGTPFSTTRALASLVGGGNSTATTTLTIPAGTAFGSYFLSAVADCPTTPCAAPGAITEADETNNGLTAATQIVIGPDLQMIALTAPAFGTPGATISVPNTVMNTGSTAGAFRVAFFISPTDNTPGAGTQIGFRDIPSMLNGNNSDVTTLTIPAGTALGTYFLSAVADSNNTVAELNETNNGLTAATQIAIGADLQMTVLTPPAFATPGATISVPNTVTNAGSPVGTFRVAFFISSSSNTPGAGTQIGFRDVTSLGIGSASAVTTTLTIPGGTALGNYFLSAVADSNNVITEVSETNNGLTAATQVAIGPDLQMTALTVPATGTPGSAIQVPNTVTNAGAAAGAFRISFFISSSSNTPGAGTLVGIRDLTTGLAAGASSAVTTTVNIPGGTTPGTYFLSAVADCPTAPCASPGAVTEISETNNGLTAATQIVVGPDLQMTVLTAPGFGTPGATILVPNTVANTGAITAGFRVAFFISSSSNTPGAGVQIGFRDLTSLAAGGSSAATTTLTIPAGTAPALYFLSAVADCPVAPCTSPGVVNEISETNNGLTAATQISIGPDLQMTALTAPATGTPGATISVPNTVANTGAAAGAFRVAFFISSSDNTPGAGTQIGFRDLTGLAQASASALTTTVTIPAGTTAGTYFLSAVADCPTAPCTAPGAVTEQSETNNGLTAATQIVIQTDLQMTALTAPATGTAGSTIDIPNTVANTGTGAAGAFRVAFFISPSDNTPGAGTQIGFRDLTGLANGASSALTTTVTIPAGTAPGTYFLSAVADSNSVVPETSETNNGLTASTQVVIQTDLQMTALTAPATGTAGSTIDIPNTVANTGAGAAGAFRVAFFISSSSNTPGAGTQIGFRDLTGLANGASSALTTTVTIPAGTAPGTYFLSAVADSNNVVPETSETNNGLTAATQISIGADLQMTVVTAPSGPNVSGAAGGTIDVPNTVANTGGSSAGSFTIAFFISPSDNTPGAGTQIGTRTVTSLAAGASDAATTTLTIPAGTAAGTYFISAVADSGAVVTEISETNNGRTAASQFTIDP